MANGQLALELLRERKVQLGEDSPHVAIDIGRSRWSEEAEHTGLGGAVGLAGDGARILCEVGVVIRIKGVSVGPVLEAQRERHIPAAELEAGFAVHNRVKHRDLGGGLSGGGADKPVGERR